MKIAPSILSADFSRLGEQVRLAERGGADWIHIDVMDGHFVPNLTMGPVVVRSIRNFTKLPFDVHLMIDHPERYVEPFVEAGADILTMHVEAEGDVAAAVKATRAAGRKASVAVRPKTSLETAKPYGESVDMVLVMTVEPGFAGQSFLPEVLPKVEAARRWIDELGTGLELEVDGGVGPKTALPCVAAGASVLVAGSSVFGGKVRSRIAQIRRNVERAAGGGTPTA